MPHSDQPQRENIFFFFKDKNSTIIASIIKRKPHSCKGVHCAFYFLGMFKCIRIRLRNLIVHIAHVFCFIEQNTHCIWIPTIISALSIAFVVQKVRKRNHLINCIALVFLPSNCIALLHQIQKQQLTPNLFKIYNKIWNNITFSNGRLLFISNTEDKSNWSFASPKIKIIFNFLFGVCLEIGVHFALSLLLATTKWTVL